MSWDPTRPVHPGLFGRIHRAEPFRAERLHVYDGAAPLKEKEWPIPLPVLDQSDLIEQGIDTSTLVKGAPKVDALGSCTANATTASLAALYHAAGKPLPFPSDAVGAEEWAIKFYSECTRQTNDVSEEWPPTDCGSTGAACCTECEKLKLIGSSQSAANVTGALSLLQHRTVIEGTPFFYSWMNTDAQGFVDGDGSYESLMAAIESGVAGGHETCIYKIEQLAQTSTGAVDLSNTVLRVRNSWAASWGLSGDFLIHASTLDYLGSYVDFKSFVLAK